MVLKAADEIRHPHNDDLNWRESVYFNFHDPVNKLGGWLYLWVTPNKPSPSGMLAAFYKGPWPEFETMDRAMASPGHRVIDKDRWLYCYKRDVGHLIDADFDDVELCGLHLKRIEPLKRYALRFNDDAGNGFDLDCRFMTEPYDYGDGVNASPGWVAANRYHRAWKADGVLRIGGQTYNVDCTGDSDHSWGQRDMAVFGANLFKMWSFQTPDGKLSLSAVQLGMPDKNIDLGFLHIGDQTASIADIQSSAQYDADGAQGAGALRVTDALGRSIEATFGPMHSFLGMGGTASGRVSWGYEGVNEYDVKGTGKIPGLISYFWPNRITPADLQAGRAK